MTETEHQERSFVKDDDMAIIVCPSCSAAKTISVAQFRNAPHTVTVKCKCGKAFKVLLDFRQSYRKPTNLTGIYAMQPPAVGGGMVKIRDVSLTGLCFEVKGVHDIKIGQKAVVEFTLDSRKETKIKKQVTIRSIRTNAIGCEFHQDQAFEKDLGFYLRF